MSTTRSLPKARCATQVGKFTLSGDGLCVGYDSGDAVSEEYKSPGKFKGGTILVVGVTVEKAQYLDLEKLAAAAFARRLDAVAHQKCPAVLSYRSLAIMNEKHNNEEGAKIMSNNWNHGTTPPPGRPSRLCPAVGHGEHGFVPPADRIAAFDNDGTLWCEKPLPIQLDFILRRWVEIATRIPRWVAAALEIRRRKRLCLAGQRDYETLRRGRQ